jgi:serine protease AprX
MHKKFHSFLPVLFTLLTLSALFASAFAPASATAPVPWRDKVDPWVLETAAEGDTEFLIYLVEQADLSGASTLGTKLDKGTYVYQKLTEVAQRTQKPVLDELKRLGVAYRPYWVANMIWVRAGMDILQALAARPDVAHVYANPTVTLNEPVEPSVDLACPDPDPDPEWNIVLVGASQAWDLGFKGQGVVVAGADTGYDWDHPALKNHYRGWNGSTADHNYNWFDATAAGSQTPVDPYGHGTHTMGIMVGDNGAGVQVGMAPEAQWIGCRNMDAGGAGSPATYTTCYQFFIAPTDLQGNNADPSKAPDVINNSWGCTYGEGCTDPTMLQTIVENVRAAGILSAHSAGNSGSACSTVNEPAAIYDASFTVGATTSSDNLASFSSRGPVTVDGSNRPKPDISAPGVSVCSSLPGTGYGIMSGTSMAAPHVAGLVALILSAQPALAGQVDQLEALIEQSALHIPATGCSSSGVPNNLYGWGRIDALQAVLSVMQHHLEIEKTASSAEVAPGQDITYTLTITHMHSVSETTGVVLTDTVPTGTTFLSATLPYTLDGNTVSWNFASLGVTETRSVELAVQVALTATGTITNADYGVRSDEVSPVRGEPVGTVIVPFEVGLSKVGPPQVAPGGNLTYTLVVTNLNPLASMHNLVLTDVLPAQTTFVTATQPYSLSDGLLSWEYAALSPGAAAGVEMVVHVPLTASGTVTNLTYGVRGDEFSPQEGTPVESQVVPFDMALSKTAADWVHPGASLTYTLAVVNQHPFAALHNLVLTDTLPAHTDFLTATQPYSLSDSIIRWELSSLGPGSTWQVELVVQAPITFTGTISNEKYAVLSDELGWQSGEPVQTQIQALVVGKTASVSAVAPGDLLTYTLAVTNAHPLEANFQLVLTDTLPVGTEFITATTGYTLSNGIVSWERATLGPGEVWMVQLVVRVAEDFRGQVVNENYAAWSAEVPEAVRGQPVYTWVWLRFYLPMTWKAPEAGY